jgi:hypothetical protein
LLDNCVKNNLDTTLDGHDESEIVTKGCKVLMKYQRPEASASLELSLAWAVEPVDELIQELKYLLGSDQVSLVY